MRPKSSDNEFFEKKYLNQSCLLPCQAKTLYAGGEYVSKTIIISIIIAFKSLHNYVEQDYLLYRVLHNFPFLSMILQVIDIHQ